MTTLLSFPRRFDTMVGERGVTLSGGQKQRIAIARALIKEPRILIMDDSLSAVDTETEEAILQNLQEFFPGRTVIIVSHRISTVQGADQIFVLEEGQITQRGVPTKNLLRKRDCTKNCTKSSCWKNKSRV